MKKVIVYMVFFLIIFSVILLGSEKTYALMGTINSEDQNYAYILDATDPSNIKTVFASNEEMSVDLTYRKNDFVYFATTETVPNFEYSDFFVVDIEDINKPKEIFRIRDNNGQFVLIAENDPYLYIGGYQAGLYIVDVSNPSTPEIVKIIKIRDFTGVDGIKGAKIYNDYLFLTSLSMVAELEYSEESKLGLYIVDISSHLEPSVKKYIYTGHHGIFGFNIIDNLLYACIDGVGLNIYDVSNPIETNLVETIEYNYPNPSDICFNGDYAYVGDMGQGILVFKMNGPTEFELVNNITDPSYVTLKLEIFENILYSASADKGLTIYNLENPENPELIGRFYIPAGAAYCLKIFKK